MGGLAGLIAIWGLPLICLGSFLEGDSVALLAGTLAHRGLYGWPTVWLVVAAGAYLSDQVWFHAGRHLSRQVRLRRILDRPLARHLRDRIATAPVRLMIAFRGIPGTRIVVPALLGHAGANALTFALVDAATVLVWAAVMTGAGYGVGVTIHRLLGPLDLAHHMLLVVGIVAGAAVIAAAIRHRVDMKEGQP